MAYILKELAGVDKLQAMKLVPAPTSNKANTVGKYSKRAAIARNNLEPGGTWAS